MRHFYNRVRFWRLLLRNVLLMGITVAICAVAMLGGAASLGDLTAARDRQDVAALDAIIKQYQQALQQNPNSGEALYKLGLANSYAAEVAMELHDKKKSEAFAEAGLDPAKKAVDRNGNNAEYHRLLGELCGQVIPANPIFGALKYGQCARDEINKALELDNKLALAYVSRGVGNYYLPASMGGGLEAALKDFDQAIAINPKLAEAYLWKGLTLRKANRNAEARKDLQRAMELAPGRLWAKEQLSKTPAS